MTCSFLSSNHLASQYAVVVLGLLLMGCKPIDKKDTIMTQKTEPDLTFSCVYEKDTLPAVDPEADVWFKQARELEKVNKSQRDYTQIGVLYRKAAERNHPKAMLNLSNLISYGKVPPIEGKGSAQEVWDIIQKMAKLNISYGYYQMGHYLDTGYGVAADRTKALAYFRQAADLGSPEAQYVIGDIFVSQRLSDRDNPAYRPEIGKKMLDCSANQGNGEAAYRLASYLKNVNEDSQGALKYYQLSTKNGYLNAAITLIDAFDPETTSKDYDYLSVKPDKERSSRYGLIRLEIRNNPEARFPDIDKIVPLPPAELPEWDGSFEYKKQVEGQ
ncbi:MULTISPECIES: SEL1-like repeat protein [Providencia]|uniref:SEL1-like repeat protein n=5 Tax=Morganellaceae TaxID=1903414 RepID=UPI00287A1B1A|nr:sel1 repeat family protein [Providencia stuartii]